MQGCCLYTLPNDWLQRLKNKTLTVSATWISVCKQTGINAKLGHCWLLAHSEEKKHTSIIPWNHILFFPAPFKRGHLSETRCLYMYITGIYLNLTTCCRHLRKEMMRLAEQLLCCVKKKESLSCRGSQEGKALSIEIRSKGSLWGWRFSVW